MRFLWMMRVFMLGGGCDEMGNRVVERVRRVGYDEGGVDGRISR